MIRARIVPRIRALGGSTLDAHLHFHCVVIDGVFDSAVAGGVLFHRSRQ